MSRIRAVLGTPAALRRTALAAVIANVGIVITGGAVRLTGSGLGCPTWPRCTADSYTPTAAMGVHGVIEFGNRLLTFAVALVAVLGLLAALLQRPRRPRTVPLAVLAGAVVPAQGLVGGLTVLTELNPWVVGCHFLVSMAAIAAAFAFWRAAGGGPVSAWRATPAPSALSALRGLAAVTLAVSAAVLVLGTVVTGSGPHAGDADARRNNLDSQAVAQLHADGVFLLVGLSVGLWFALRAVDGRTRAATVLILVELGQGAIGFVQYLTDLPVVMVAAHMAGACLVWLATLAAYATLSADPAAPGGDPAAPARRPDPPHLDEIIDHAAARTPTSVPTSR